MSQTALNLISDAGASGVLSPGSASIIGVSNIGTSIMNALGKPPGEVVASEAVVCGVLIDDSGSIGGNHQHVRDGYNGLLDALQGARHATEIVVHCNYLSGFSLCPFIEVANAPRMDTSNYQATYGSTPLYERMLHLLAAVAAKVQQFEGDGIPARGITLGVTDGGNNVFNNTAQEVATVVGDMLRSERHIIAGMGIGDDSYFKPIFTGMGILPNWILTPGATGKEIRAAFQTFSQSAVRASQSTTSFSKAAAGGFGS